MHPETLAWLQEVTGETSLRGIASKVSRSHSTVHRWIHEGMPPDVVVDVAIKVNVDIITALVAAGWVTESERENLNLDETLRRLPAVKLTGEIHRRALEADHN